MMVAQAQLLPVIVCWPAAAAAAGLLLLLLQLLK
jgi:hypothetical protein